MSLLPLGIGYNSLILTFNFKMLLLLASERNDKCGVINTAEGFISDDKIGGKQLEFLGIRKSLPRVQPHPTTIL